MEVWKDIPDYGGKYQISNQGRVRSFTKWSNGKILKAHPQDKSKGSYKHVQLVGKGRGDIKCTYIHRLVAEAFLDNPLGYNEVNHKDGNTYNNNSENLEWCEHMYNMHHAFENGLISHEFERGKLHPKSKPVIQMTKDGEFVKEWESVNQVQRETQFLASNIFRCCNPKTNRKSAYGYIWEYKHG